MKNALERTRFASKFVEEGRRYSMTMPRRRHSTEARIPPAPRTPRGLELEAELAALSPAFADDASDDYVAVTPSKMPTTRPSAFPTVRPEE